MKISILMPTCALLLACSVAAHAQQATSWVSAEWRPVTEENTRLFQQADADFKSAVEEDYQRRDQAAKSDHAARGSQGSGPGGVTATDQNAPIPDGMRGPGEPRGTRKAQRPTTTSLEQLLPPALDFAAPASAGLIVQRMSGSVLFGRTDSAEVVMLPLSGEADLPHGMRGEIREEGDQLRLRVQLPSGQAVEYRYSLDPDPANRAMSVEVSILGALPGKSIGFRRLYRRAQVNVGELKKAGQ